MGVGVKRLVDRVERHQTKLGHAALHGFQGQLDTFDHRLEGFVLLVGQFDGTLKVVQHRQQFVGELLQSKLVRLLHIQLGTTAQVLHLGGGTQGAFTLFRRFLDGGFQLRFQFGNAGLLGCHFTVYIGRLDWLGFHLLHRFNLLLFVVHDISNSGVTYEGPDVWLSDRTTTDRLCWRYYGDASPAFKG